MKCSVFNLTILSIVFAILSFHDTYAQSEEAEEPQYLSAGLEVDVLPYVLNGYMGAAWVSKNHFRLRALFAHVKMPDFITPDEFTNNKINSFAFLLDYYQKKDLSGFWIGGGPVIWDGSIQSEQRRSSVKYKSYLLNGSIGYSLFLTKNLYLSPWAGLSFRFAGDKNITVDGYDYDPPFLNPELSLKLGWRFF
ncbi:hypothetical protein [Robertkochia solimangrovi]|uniref:hypothetical protein n=1 Tax=Robertkochia solimangrovi TaxID=2213046 RepID=UPI001180D3B3|nr:hypothetical protein [Robertkochia solimangrovi]TRZ44481.1 hypothetical protein DMZ48_08245 [Robertkochia solimangrovi]